ncbi:helix-turn-helix transcriptional regulator [Paenibacillus albidus]|uniref:helix-turn-helix transcriptional regulator n=1 Tax=Paenibacillus albidus TaxID=2041023 RepID=UPI001BED05DF|nr:helix-turn-helix transcriptional regulator [Paenibacillus albidus]MBT2289919.1 helix-turn-helix transcriptional regulator [Paenibacillus albidus]
MRNHIRLFREHEKMTQQELADRVGVSRQTIISLESGKYNPSILLAHKLASTFKRYIEEIFIFEEDEDE